MITGTDPAPAPGAAAGTRGGRRGHNWRRAGGERQLYGLAEPPRAMRGTRRAGAQWRTAQPLTRLDGGGYPGPFWVGVFVAVTAVGVKY